MTPVPSHTAIVLSAFTSATMTVEKLSYNSMLSKANVSAALEDLRQQGRVEVAGGAWTLISNKKKGSTTVTPSPTKKASAKRVATKKAPAKKVAVKKAAPKKAPAKVVPINTKAASVATARKSVASANGAKKHTKVAERDDKVLSIITASKKSGVTDEEIAKAMKTTLGIAYQSVRRLKDEGKIESAKGDNGVTRRYAS